MAIQRVMLLDYYENQSSIIKQILDEFKKSIFENVFFTNLPILKTNSDYYDFTNDSWYQRPTVFCLDIYSEPQLFPIILLVNNIKTFFEFVPEKFNEMPDGRKIIIAPHFSTILDILKTSTNY